MQRGRTVCLGALPRAAPQRRLPRPASSPHLQHSRVDYFNTDELKVVELVLQDGEWRAARHNPMTLVSTPSAPSVHISSTSTTATLGRPSAELGPRGSYEAQQLSGRLPTVGSVRSGRYVARPGSALPVMREDGEAAA